jgi:hypothetical protein
MNRDKLASTTWVRPPAAQLGRWPQGDIVTIKSKDNVDIVVEDIDVAMEFFTELGLTLEGRTAIEDEWAGRVTGVRGQRVEIAMMHTPDGHGRLELSRGLAQQLGQQTSRENPMERKR